nr:hypothetical protein Iba_chr13dCG8250 [Ipomoea batatas]
MQGSSLVNASFSGSQQDGGGVVVEFRYSAHAASFAAHDGGDWASAIIAAATIAATTNNIVGEAICFFFILLPSSPFTSSFTATKVWGQKPIAGNVLVGSRMKEDNACAVSCGKPMKFKIEF